VLSGLTVTPPVISPDGDGIADAVSVSYALASRAGVTATVKDFTGTVVATLFSNQAQSARRQSFAYGAGGLADGMYTLAISATAFVDGRTMTLEAPFAIDRTLTGLALSTAAFTPNGDGVDDTLGINFTLSTQVYVTVQIEQAGSLVATVFTGPLPGGLSQIHWDGTTPAGPAVPGTYDAVVIVDGIYGQTRHAASFTLSP
jgi:hypothetical protein